MSSNTDHTKIRKLLEQTTHYDRDERFMATSDLKAALEMIQGEIDNDLQIPIRDAVLTQLDDGSSEVQGMAVSCLSAIVLKFAESSVSEIVNKLGKLLIEGKPELRDSYADGLKTIITAVPDSFGDNVSHRLIQYLLGGIQNVDTDEIDKTNFSLDVLETLLQKFGVKFSDSHDAILKALYPLIHNENKNLRRRIPVTLGVLVNYLPDEQFDHLMDTVIGQIEAIDEQDDVLYTYIQSIGIVGRHAGVRIGKYLSKIVPLLIKFCCDEKEGRAFEEIVELREKCLQAFEALILQCPNDITPYVDEIIRVALTYIDFDPNWQGESSEGKDDMEDDDDGDWGDDEAGDDLWGTGDADADVVQDMDDAWRVRRACVKALAAFITAKTGTLRDKYDELCEGLIKSFTDRDVDVKLEVFHATRDLVSATVLTTAPLEMTRMPSLGPPPLLTRTLSLENDLERHIGIMMVGLLKQIRVGEPMTQQGALSVVKELCIVRHGGLQLWFDELFPFLISCVRSTNTTLRSKSLDLFALILHYHPPSAVVQFVPAIADPVIESIEDPAGRIKTQGLDVCSRIAQVVRPDYTAYDDSMTPVMKNLYHVCLKQLALVDIEQQVKVASLKAVADLTARFGDIVPYELPKTFALLMDRLGNDVTRLAALKAVTKIATSPVTVDISTIKTPALDEIVQFLRQQSPEIRRESATALLALLQNANGGGLDKKVIPKLLNELPPHINDQDLYLTHLIFRIISSCLIISPRLKLPQEIHDGNMILLHSPLVQGSEALPSLIDLFVTLVNKTKSVTYARLLQELLDCTSDSLSPQAFSAIAQCIAGITCETDKKQQDKTVTRFINDVDHKDDCVAQVSLLCLGDIGRRKDLSKTRADQLVFKAFSRKSESVRQAASYSLGRLSVGNMNKYMPILLRLIEQSEDRRYLLLNSLKENIAYHSSDHSLRDIMKQHTDAVLPLLITNSSSKDEGVRIMVAECLGQLATVDCDKVFPEIERHLAHKSPEIRQTMVASVKYALDGDMNVKRRLKDNIQQFLELMVDSEMGPDLDVRRHAFMTLNAVLNNDLNLVQVHLRKTDRDDPDPKILKTIYEATVFKKELVTEQELGAIKVRMDAGLPLRKAAFLMMGTLTEVASFYLEISKFIEYLKNGFTDPNSDIQLMTYQILTGIAVKHGAELLNVVGSLPPHLKKGVVAQLKISKGNDNEADQAMKVLGAAVKALDAINKINGAQAVGGFQTFFKSVLKTQTLKKMLQVLHDEAETKEKVSGK